MAEERKRERRRKEKREDILCDLKHSKLKSNLKLKFGGSEVGIKF
jgi:hypothetical protein